MKRIQNRRRRNLAIDHEKRFVTDIKIHWGDYVTQRPAPNMSE
jgi:hypothetical protein